ncbi:hypothetical protein I4F81_001955 [Pyropia yezoensis]|uniref:Uncharacterized protein n=1 Tax=Pyropia yezoensis TaxID=2788 RepID=A0ACC3BN55_PYRYE|nr:hypothetical protein I4F81_001955 [Neopyropia yezoensis]
MVAIMGASGSGKTTLLNLLAGRLPSAPGVTSASGSVRVNGSPRDGTTFKQLAAYVVQDSSLFAHLTVRETLAFSARLRLPPSLAAADVDARVDAVCAELGLSPAVSATRIGGPFERGISGGERKRVTIGVELVTDPSLLFLDEPTTGLDAFNALAMMGTLRRLASSGRSVVATIHQPRSAIYAMVDTLLLLAGGRVAYYGPAAGAVAHFARLGFRCPPRFNPADFFIDLTAVPSAPAAAAAAAAARIRHLARHAHSSRAAGAASAVGVAPAEGGVAAGGGGVVRRPAGRRDLRGAGAHHLSSSSSHSSSRGGTPGMAGEVDKAAPVVAGDAPPIAGRRRPAWPREFRILLGRAARLMVRERRANAIRAFQTIVFATVLSLIWLNQGRDAGVAGVSGILFVLLINQSMLGTFSVIFVFPLERAIITRERAAGTYRVSAYYIAKVLSEAPRTLLYNTVFSVILYWCVGLRASAAAFLFFILALWTTTMTAEALALSISIAAPSPAAAMALSPPAVIVSLLFGGFFIQGARIPDWLGWLRWVSFVHYAYGAIMHNQFVDGVGAVNGLSRWGNVGALAGLMVVFRAGGYVALRTLRAPSFDRSV